MSHKLAQTLPSGHRVTQAQGKNRKSPKSAARRMHSPTLTGFEEHLVVLAQSAIRRRLATQEKVTLAKNRARRVRILQEIKATESVYVQNLAVLVESFLNGLAKNEEFAEVLKPKLQQEFALVLPGVEMIRSYHVTLLSALEDIDMDDPFFEVGGIFLDVVMYFKSYSQYVSHYQVIVQILAQRKQDTDLQAIFEGMKPQSLGKGLKDYMIMPVQRIPRYALLLHDMLKHTWRGHPDAAALSTAYNKVLDIAHNIENMSADAVSIAKVFELANCFLSNGDVFKLVVPHRRYIADAECLCSLPAKGVVMKSLQVFLFNDIILWAKPKKDNKFNVIYSMPTLMLANICMTDLWQEAGGSEFIEMETLDSERLRMIVTEKNEEWYQYLLLTKDNGKAWLPHHTSRDVSTTARYLTVGGEAAKAARQSPKVKDTTKSKNKSIKLLGALRAKASKKDVRDLGWKLSNKDKDGKEADSHSQKHAKDAKKSSTSSTATTMGRIASLDLEKVSEPKEKKGSSRPKSSRSNRDKLDQSGKSGAFKRTLSDRGTKDKMIFSDKSDWHDEERGRERERDRDRERSKDKDRGKESEKDRERSNRDLQRKPKRRTSKPEILDQLSPRRKGSSGSSIRSRDPTSPRRSGTSPRKSKDTVEKRPRRKPSGSATDEELDPAMLMEVKTRPGRKHRKVASSEGHTDRRHSASSVSPREERSEGRRGSKENTSSDKDSSSSSHERRDRKKRSHRSRSKSKKKTQLELPSDGEDSSGSPSVLRKSYSLTHVPSPRDSTSDVPEQRAQRRTRGRKVSSSSMASDDESADSEAEPTQVAHALSTPTVLHSEGASPRFETAINPKKMERARNARAMLRQAQRDSSDVLLLNPHLSQMAQVGRKPTAEVVVTPFSKLDRKHTSQLAAPSPSGSVASNDSGSESATLSASSSCSSLPSSSAPKLDSSSSAAAILPVPSPVFDSDEDVPATKLSSNNSSAAASPSAPKRTHRRVRSIGARVSPSISRSPGSGHRRRRSGSHMEEEAEEKSAAEVSASDSVRNLVEVFMTAQQKLVASPTDSKKAAARASSAAPSGARKVSTPMAAAERKGSAAAAVATERKGSAAAAVALFDASEGASSDGSDGESGGTGGGSRRGRWRRKSGVCEKTHAFSSSASASAMDHLSPMAGRRQLGSSRTGEPGKPIRCTPADFARHDSLQEISTVSSLLGQFRALEHDKEEAGSRPGTPDPQGRRPMRMNSEDPSALTPRTRRSNSMEPEAEGARESFAARSPHASPDESPHDSPIASPHDSLSDDAGAEESVTSTRRRTQRRESRTRPRRRASHNPALGRSVTSSALVGTEFTPVTAIFDSLAQQGVKDPTVLGRLEEARQSDSAIATAVQSSGDDSEDSDGSQGTAYPSAFSSTAEGKAAAQDPSHEDSDSTSDDYDVSE